MGFYICLGIMKNTNIRNTALNPCGLVYLLSVVFLLILLLSLFIVVLYVLIGALLLFFCVVFVNYHAAPAFFVLIFSCSSAFEFLCYNWWLLCTLCELCCLYSMFSLCICWLLCGSFSCHPAILLFCHVCVDVVVLCLSWHSVQLSCQHCDYVKIVDCCVYIQVVDYCVVVSSFYQI